MIPDRPHGRQLGRPLARRSRRGAISLAGVALATAAVTALASIAGSAPSATAAPARPHGPAIPAVALQSLSPSVPAVRGLSTAGSHQVLLALASRQGAAGVPAIRALAQQPLPATGPERSGAIQRRRALLSQLAPAADSLAVVRAFAAGRGLAVYQATSTTITLDGTPAQLAAVFGTSLTRTTFTDALGHHRVGVRAAGRLAVPAELASVVSSAVGLDDTVLVPHAQAPPGDPTPQKDRRNVYSTAYNAHYGGFVSPTADGHGVTIAITTELGQTIDPATYQASIKLAGVKNNPIPVDANYDPADPGPFSGNSPGQLELMIDMVAIAGVAPRAQQRVYSYGPAAGPTLGQVLAYYAALADDATAGIFQVATESYGLCEQSAFFEGLLNPASVDSSAASAPASLARLVAAGATYFASSGDDGGFCKNHTTPSVNYPASDPSVVAVGGTSWPDSSSSGADDYAWNRRYTESSGAKAEATGGGFSTHFARPTYQPASFGPVRALPDVSAIADQYAGGEYLQFPDSTGTIRQFNAGGTSLASPVWAGWLADVLSTTVTGTAVAPGLGDIHPALYANATTAFDDVVAGNDFVSPAGVGYDPVTGLGVPKLQVLAKALLTPLSAPTLALPAFTNSTTVPIATNITGDRHYRGARAVAGADSCASPPAPGPLPTTAAIPPGDGVKTVSLTTLDLLGHCVTTSATTTLDTQPPVLTGAVVMSPNRTQGIATVSVAEAVSGIRAFSAQVVNRDTGTVVLTVTTNGGPYVFTGPPGHYVVTASAVDGAGNATPAFSSAPTAGVPLDDRSLARTTGWTSYTRGGRLNNTVTGSSKKGATLTAKRFGVNTSFGPQQLFVLSGGGGGYLKVFVDGSRVALLRLNRFGPLRAMASIPAGAHTIQLQRASGFVVIDGLQVS